METIGTFARDIAALFTREQAFHVRKQFQSDDKYPGNFELGS